MIVIVILIKRCDKVSDVLCYVANHTSDMELYCIPMDKLRWHQWNSDGMFWWNKFTKLGQYINVSNRRPKTVTYGRKNLQIRTDSGKIRRFGCRFGIVTTLLSCVIQVLKQVLRLHICIVFAQLVFSFSVRCPASGCRSVFGNYLKEQAFEKGIVDQVWGHLFLTSASPCLKLLKPNEFSRKKIDTALTGAGHSSSKCACIEAL